MKATTRRTFSLESKMRWECKECGSERMKTKPGASEGSLAVLTCGSEKCGYEKTMHECIGKQNDGVPFDQ
jgi:hypothetical protein